MSIGGLGDWENEIKSCVYEPKGYHNNIVRASSGKRGRHQPVGNWFSIGSLEKARAMRLGNTGRPARALWFFSRNFATAGDTCHAGRGIPQSTHATRRSSWTASRLLRRPKRNQRRRARPCMSAAFQTAKLSASGQRLVLREQRLWMSLAGSKSVQRAIMLLGIQSRGNPIAGIWALRMSARVPLIVAGQIVITRVRSTPTRQVVLHRSRSWTSKATWTVLIMS